MELNIKDIVIPNAPAVEGEVTGLEGFDGHFSLTDLLNIIIEFIRNLIKFEF